MSDTKTLKTYVVSGKLVLIVDVTIEAETLQAALAKGENLEVKDFVEFKGDWVDGEGPDIVAVYSRED